MNIIETQSKFEERFYLWSKELLKQEISENLPILRSVKGTLARHYLNILEQLDKHQAYKMAYALMRRGTRKEILDKWDDSFTSEDQEYVDLWLKMMNIEDRKDVMKMSPIEYMQRRRFNSKVLRKHVKTALEPVLGGNYENWGGGTWRYCTNIGTWKVITWINTNKQCRLSYDQSIEISNVTRLCEGGLTILHWFGIANSFTDWNELEDEDFESAAFSLAKIIELFIKAAPKLLAGLSPYD